MVEKVPDWFPDGSIRRHYGSRIPTLLHRLQLPQSVRPLDRVPRRPLLLPLQRFLPENLQETQSSNPERQSQRCFQRKTPERHRLPERPIERNGQTERPIEWNGQTEWRDQGRQRVLRERDPERDGTTSEVQAAMT